MSLIAAKLVLTPLAIGAAMLVTRRWGAAVGGWLTGLPLTSGPVALFLALEQGPAFAAAASAGSIAGVSAQACFCLGYGAAARAGWVAGFFAGAAFYVVDAVLLQWIHPAPLMLAAVGVCMLAATRRLLPIATGSFPRLRAPFWEMPARIALVTSVVVAVTSAAGALGPRASGVTASFPWIAIALTVFAHRAHGPSAAMVVLRGLALALFAFLAFFVVLGAALTRVDTAFAFALATAAAATVQAGTLRFARPGRHSPDAAEASPAVDASQSGSA